jgi:hypothetical protein
MPVLDLVMQDEEVLGVVSYIQPAKNGGIEFCKVRPTHLWRPGGVTEVVDGRAYFPDSGLVFWYRPKINLRTGQALVFRIADTPSYDPKAGKRDRYQIPPGTTASSPIQGIRLASDVSADDLRRALATGTLPLLEAPICTQVMLQLSADTRWVGPIELSSKDGHAYQVKVEDQGAHGFVRVRNVGPELLQDVKIGDNTYRLFKRADELPEHCGYFVTQSDPDLVKSLIERIKQRDPSADAALSELQVLVERYLASFQGVALKRRDALREAAREDAAKALIASLVQWGDAGRVESIAQQLLSLPGVRSELDALCQAEVIRARAEAQTSIEAELTSGTERLRVLSDAENAARQVLNGLERQFCEAADRLVADSASRLAEHAIVRALTGGSAAKRAAPRNEAETLKVRTLRTVDDFKGAAMGIAATFAIDPYVLQVASGVASASGLLLLAGSNADRVATGIGRLLAADRFCRVQINAGIFGVGDLLRAPCAPVYSGVATQLGSFVEASEREDGFAVVVLQGCNRAPLENVLWDLGEFANSLDEHRRLAWSDHEGNVRELRLSRRLLILGTLANGPTVFHMPRSSGHRIPVLWSDRSVVPAEVENQVAPEFFRLSTEILECNPAMQVPDLDDFAKGIPELPASTIRKRILAASAVFGNTDVACAELLASFCAGRSTPDELRQLASKLPATTRQYFEASIGGSLSLKAFFEKNERA